MTKDKKRDGMSAEAEAAALLKKYFGDDFGQAGGRRARPPEHNAPRRGAKPGLTLREWHPRYDWRKSSNGNHVAIESGEVVATVYMAKGYYAWQIVLNRGGKGHFVQDEYFEATEDAMQRAEDILMGAACDTSTGKW